MHDDLRIDKAESRRRDGKERPHKFVLWTKSDQDAALLPEVV